MKAYSEWGAGKAVIDRIEPTHYFRNRLIVRLIKKFSKNCRMRDVCEIGCGTGSLSLALGKMGLNVDAFDIDGNAVSLAKRFSSHKNVNYIHKDALSIKAVKKYDMVMAVEVLEHIMEDSEVLLNIGDILNKNGILLITVPIHEKYRREFDNRSGHIRRYEPGDIMQKIRDAGFDVKYARYFNFPLLWIWYFHFYLPYSDKKEEEAAISKNTKKKLPKLIGLMRIANKIFLIDLLFNSRKYSTDMVVMAKKL